MKVWTLKNPYIQGALIGWTICAIAGFVTGWRSEVRETHHCHCKK